MGAMKKIENMEKNLENLSPDMFTFAEYDLSLIHICSERAGSEPGGVPMKEETFKILFWNGRILNQRYHQLCGIIPHLK